jgi:hypothetical protein
MLTTVVPFAGLWCVNKNISYRPWKFKWILPSTRICNKICMVHYLIGGDRLELEYKNICIYVPDPLKLCKREMKRVWSCDSFVKRQSAISGVTSKHDLRVWMWSMYWGVQTISLLSICRRGTFYESLWIELNTPILDLSFTNSGPNFNSLTLEFRVQVCS